MLLAQPQEKNLTLLSKRQDFFAGVKACLPTLLGYLSIGLAAGIIEKTAGLSILEITLLSTLLYAGSGQFVTAAMIAARDPISSIIFTVFFLNLRHLLLSASLSPYLQKLSPLKNFFVGSLLTDETFGVAIFEGLKKKQISYNWMIGLNLAAYVNWILANIIGGLCGSMITNFENYGADFALPAMFAGLVVFQLCGEKTKLNLYLLVFAFTMVTFFITNSIFPGIWGVMLTAIIGSTFGLLMELKWK